MIVKIKDLEDLSDFAQDFAKRIKVGDTVCLNGELGSGKTQFVKLVAKHLGYKGEVSSPTFCFMNEYEIEDEFSLYHFDLYRLDDSTELSEIGFDEYGYSPHSGISFIEWSDKFEEEMPEGAIKMLFFGHGDEERKIEIR